MSEKPAYRAKLDEQAAEDRRSARIDYTTTAFMLKAPYSSAVVSGPRRLRGREEHRKMLDEARRRKMYVWMAAVVKSDSGFAAVPPHIVDWESVPDQPYDSDPSHADGQDDGDEDGGRPLTCRECGKVCSSQSGLTLHEKSHGKAQPQKAQPQKSVRQPARDDEADEDGDDEGAPTKLRCPHCGKLCFSTSGLTLHVKNKHGGK